jgi:cyclophilin family peptidyl-prolyl cis-trans isomerase
MLRRLLPALFVLAWVLAGCGSDDGDGGAADQATTATSTTTTAGCRKVAAPAAKGEQNLRKPTQPLTQPTTVKLTTNCGTIRIRLDVERAPKTSASFASLARRHFYDGLTFHRVVPGFVVQGGDPLGTGLGGPGYEVVERPPASTAYTRRTVAMAKAPDQPRGASGSQFFIVTAENADLPPDYALVGRVAGAYSAVAKLEATPTGQGDVPTEPLVIERATVTSG